MTISSRSFLRWIRITFSILTIATIFPAYSFSEPSDTHSLTTGDKELISVMQRHQERLLTKLDGFVNKLKEQDIRIEKQGEMLDKVMQENASLIRENQDFSTRFETLKGNFEEYKLKSGTEIQKEFQAKLDAEKSENARLSSKISELETSGKISRSEENAETATLRKKVDELELIIASQNKEVDSSKKTLVQLAEEKRVLEEKIKKAESVSVAQVNAETMALRNKVAQLESAITSQKNESNSSDISLAQLTGEKLALEKKLKEMEHRVTSEENEKKNSQLLLANIQEELRETTLKLDTNTASRKVDALSPKDTDTKNLQIGDQLAQLLGEQLNDPRIELKRYSTKNILVLRDADMFSSGRSVAQKETQELMAKLGKLIKQISGMNIEVVGHTNNDPIHNSFFASNWELSTARAASIANLLITQSNFSPKSIRAVGKAEYEPVTSNDTSTGKALNRRIEIIVTANRPEEREIGADMILQKTISNAPPQKPREPELQPLTVDADTKSATTTRIEEKKSEENHGDFLTWLFQNSEISNQGIKKE